MRPAGKSCARKLSSDRSIPLLCSSDTALSSFLRIIEDSHSLANCRLLHSALLTKLCCRIGHASK